MINLHPPDQLKPVAEMMSGERLAHEFHDSPDLQPSCLWPVDAPVREREEDNTRITQHLCIQQKVLKEYLTRRCLRRPYKKVLKEYLTRRCLRSTLQEGA